MKVTISDCPLCMDSVHLRTVVRFRMDDAITEEHIHPHDVPTYMADPRRENLSLLRVYCEKHRLILEPLTY